MVPLNTSVHSREPKMRAADVHRYFVSKKFINHLYNNTGLYASWSLPSGVLRS